VSARGLRVPALAGLALASLAQHAGAQSVRIRSLTTARYVELQPVVWDAATSSYLAAGSRYAAPLTQDIELSAWGFGVPGLRAWGLFRFRGAVGSELVWPRYDDHFDALHAFLEYEQRNWRARLGRQQRTGPLGFYAWDGASAVWRPRSTLRLEALAGRSLSRGFLEPLNSDAIRALDPAIPDRAGILLGASAWAAPWAGWSVGGTWLRQILANRSAIVSERGALDVQAPIGEQLIVSGAIDGDFAARALGRTRLGVQWRLPRRGFIEVEAFRYRPVFDLTTIWGVFSPEGHHGFAAAAEVAATGSVTATADLTWRRYRPATETTPFLAGIDDHSLSAALGARWQGRELLLNARYRLQTGYGGAQSGGDVRLAWERPERRWRAGLRGVAFQEDEQFRLHDGTVYGLGVDGRFEFGPRLALRGEMLRYWHRGSEGQAAIDWSQTRLLLGVDWTFGASADRVAGYR
jgi:hypothetical protein